MTRRRVHGEAGSGKWGRHTLEYTSWSGALNRCYNPKCKKFDIYGGRGIKMCRRWRRSYLNFLADMGRKPSPKYSLERKNVNGNYSPSNCKWATASEQMRNRRPFKMTVLRKFTDAEIRAEFNRRHL